MTPHDIGPFYLELVSVTGGVPHVSQHSIKDWVSPSFGHDFGTVEIRSTGHLDAVTAVEEYVDILCPFFTDGTSFINWQIFSKPTPTDLPVPVTGKQLTGKVGTHSGGLFEEATQLTITYRTTAFNKVKFILLDYVDTTGFAKVTALPGSGILFDLDAYVRGDNAFITGRDGAFPNVFMSATGTLNRKQRKIRRLD